VVSFGRSCGHLVVFTKGAEQDDEDDEEGERLIRSLMSQEPVTIVNGSLQVVCEMEGVDGVLLSIAKA
jgi:hypothetical protein